jgi:lysophospholipase L1-like esterase
MNALKRLCFLLIVVVVAFFILEACARLLHVEQASGMGSIEDWLVTSPVVGWERKPGYKGTVGWYLREFDAAGYFTIDSEKVSIKARTKKKTIIFIGDSSTFGFGVPTSSSFVELTEKFLPSANAINLGALGYTSYQGRKVLEKYLPVLKPDLVVASFNFNDRRYVLEPGASDSPEQFERIYRRSAFGSLLEMSYLLRFQRRVMKSAGLLPDPPMVSVDLLKPRVDENSYRTNLSWIAAETNRRGIPLIFIVLKDDPIRAFHLNEGMRRFAEFDEAVAYLSAAVESGNASSDLARLYLSRLYSSRGDTIKAAKIALSRPQSSTFGGPPIRADSTYNNIMRQVARDSHVGLVDGAEVLDDWDYIDNVHFNEHGHRKIAELLASRISLMNLGQNP